MNADETGDTKPDYFRVNIFQIDSYNTKPTYSHDKTYSVFRNKNVQITSVVRIFGSTDNGIKVCLHMHQYYPHLSIRQADLAAMYGITVGDSGQYVIDDEVLNIFINDLEKQIRNMLSKDEWNEIGRTAQGETPEETDEHYIYQVELYSATPMYGYHPNEEPFYRIFFYTTFALDISKGCLQRGAINSHSVQPYNCLEFILQFYIDNQIYLNTLHLKNATFRKTEQLEKAFFEPADAAFTSLDKEKLQSLKVPITFNEISASSSCFLECDVTVDDIVRPERVRNFPANPTHMPALPGIIKLWNDQYQRCQRNGIDYKSFIGIISNKMKRRPYTSLPNKLDQRLLKLFAQNTNFVAPSLSTTRAPVAESANNEANGDEFQDEFGDDDAYDQEMEETFEGEEDDDMNLTLEELNLCDQPSSNEIARTLYCLDEPAIWEENIDEEENIPQLDGMDDTPETMKKNTEREQEARTSVESKHVACKFRNEKIRLSCSLLGRASIELQKLPVDRLVKHTKVIATSQLRERLAQQEACPAKRLNTSLNSSVPILSLSSPLNTSLRSSPFSEQAKSLMGTCLQSTPRVSSLSGRNSGSRRKSHRLSVSRRRQSLNTSCRTTLENIFEQQVLQTSINSEKKKMHFILSQNSQSPQHVDDISSIISANSTEHSCDTLPIDCANDLQWNRRLEMRLMSLELHIKTRGNLTPNPHVDPIQMAIFAIYNEPLELNSSSETSDETDSEKQPLNFDYIGAIAVRPKQRDKDEELNLGRKTVRMHYVSNELDLILHLIAFVKTFDPDILLGYVVDTLSWGYLLQRSLTLELNTQALCRITNPYQAKSNFAGAANMPPTVTGRIVFNVWNLMRHEDGMSLRSYSFEHVYHHLLQERIPRYSGEHLSALWSKGKQRLGGSLNLHILLEYYFTRVTGTVKMLVQVNLVPRTFGLASLFGMRFEDALNRGSQFRVESILFPLVRLENYLPIRFNKEKVRKMPAPEFIQLVLEPGGAFYSEPVAVLDFQSLYPSIMIAYNYCYSTCLGKLKNIFRSNHTFGCHQLKTTRETLAAMLDDIHISPSGACFVKANIRKGLLPKMLEDLLYTRILIKNELKRVSGQLAKEPLTVNIRRQLKALKRQLEVCQLGLKLIANVTYGYTSANFSGRMPCVDIADSIVSKGREALEQAILFINEWGKKSGSRARVVYGDTDSVFVSFPGSTLKEAFQSCEVLVAEITQRNPFPMGIKLEKIYQPCFLLAKKRYCGNAFESADQKTGIFDAKGVETVRRDNCKAAPKILKKCIQILFEHNGDLSFVKPYLQWQVKKILNGRLSNLNDFVFAKEFWGLQFYANQSVMPSCIIARQRLLHDPLAEPKKHERVPYVIVSGSAQDRLADLVRDPSELLADRSLQLNGPYYILRAIFPVLARIFEVLPDFDHKLLIEWYNEVRHFRANKLKLASLTDNDNLRDYLATSLCILCHRKVGHHRDGEGGEQQQQYPLCRACTRSSQRSLVLLKDKAWKAGGLAREYLRICGSCTGEGMHQSVRSWPPSARHCCIAFTCPILARAHQTLADFELLSKVDQIVSARIQLPSGGLDSAASATQVTAHFLAAPTTTC